MGKKNFEELSQQILELVGGKENISYFTHCLTRLRFNIRDKGIVKVEEIQKKAEVFGTQWSGEQLQVIIGNDVSEVYKTICEIGGITKEKSVGDKDINNKQNGFKALFESTLGVMSASVAPVIPVIIAVGLLKAILSALSSFGVITAETTSYTILSFVADAGFYFLPVFVGFSAAKRFGMNQYLGALFGAMLIHPDFISLVSAGTSIELFGLPVYGGTYTSTIFSSILMVWIASHIEKYLNRHLPNIVKSVLSPFITLIVMIPLGFCLLAPIGQLIGNHLALGIDFVYHKIGFLAVGLYALINPLIVLTGMSYCIGPVMFNNLATLGYDPLIAVGAGMNNMTQLAASLAVALKTKNPRIKANAWAATTSVAIGGVSEPSLFGISVPLKTPLFAAMIGSFAGGCVSGLLHVKVYILGGQDIFTGWIGFSGAAINNILFGVIGWIVAMITTFLIIWIIGFKEGDENDSI